MIKKLINITAILLLSLIMTACVSASDKEDVFAIPEDCSDEMREIIFLAKDYLTMDRFSYFADFERVDNELFHDFSGGVQMTYEDMRNGIFGYDNFMDHYMDFYIERYFLDNNKNCVYFKIADIFNDGRKAIVIGFYDRGSLYHSYTEIWELVKAYNNDGYSYWYYPVYRLTLPGATSYRVTNHNGTNYLIKPWVDSKLYFDGHHTPSYFDIVYLKGHKTESFSMNYYGAWETWSGRSSIEIRLKPEDSTFDLVEPHWVYDFKDGLAMVTVQDEARGNHPWTIRMIIADDYGSVLIDPEEEDFGLASFEFNDKLAVIYTESIEEGHKFGYINTMGRIAIPPQFDSADDFTGGYALVSTGGRYPFVTGGKYGVIDTYGRIIVPMEYDKITRYDDYISRFLAFKYNPDNSVETWLYDTEWNKRLLPPGNNYIQIIVDGLVLAGTDPDPVIPNRFASYGALSFMGEIVIPFDYEYILPLDRGLLFAKKQGKWGAINTRGEVIIPYIYDEHFDGFYEELAMMKKDGKIGYIDRTGREAVPFIYDHGHNFSDGLALVTVYSDNGSEIFFIDKNGDLALELPYDFANPFSEGFALVSQDGKWGYINRNGEIVLPVIYDFAYDFNNGVAWVIQDGKMGIAEIYRGY